jgi:hypothetical protein
MEDKRIAPKQPVERVQTHERAVERSLTVAVVTGAAAGTANAVAQQALGKLGGLRPKGK